MKKSVRCLTALVMIAGLTGVTLHPSVLPGSSFTVASAASYTLALSPASGPSGTRTIVSGSGYPAASLVYIQWNGQLVEAVSANTSGQLNTLLTIPSAGAGSYTVSAHPLGSTSSGSAVFTISGGSGGQPTATPTSPGPPATATPTSPVPPTATRPVPPTATATPAPSGGCAATPEAQQGEAYLYGLLNSDRAANGGVPALSLSSGLSNISRAHSCDLALHNGQSWNGWPHTGSDGSSPFSRMAAGGFGMPPYGQEGENVGWAQGYPSVNAAAAAIDAQMMAEPSGQQNHRWNILNRGYTIVGVGIVQLNGWVWITEDFAG